MPRFTKQDGVFFTEDAIEGRVLAKLSVRAPSQNSLLTDLKREMARQAKGFGGNCIVRFTYSQRADSPLKNVFSFKWDTERLVGTGDVIQLSEEPTV